MTEADATESDVALVASNLAARLEGAPPEAIVAEARDAVAPGAFVVVSSFGTESAVLLDVVASVDPAIPVLLLDTGWLFPETLAYRDQLIGLTGLFDVRSLTPDAARLADLDPENFLWSSDPEACCRLRKVDPLDRALANVSAWANGRKRYQGGLRSAIPVVEADGPRLKVNPLAGLDAEDVNRRFDRMGLPRHPLQEKGFESIGCVPCTTRRKPGEATRAGRWRGAARTECGIHT